MYILYKCLTSRLLHNIRPANFSSQDICHHRLAQGLHMIQLPEPCSYTCNRHKQVFGNRHAFCQ